MPCHYKQRPEVFALTDAKVIAIIPVLLAASDEHMLTHRASDAALFEILTSPARPAGSPRPRMKQLFFKELSAFATGTMNDGVRPYPLRSRRTPERELEPVPYAPWTASRMCR